MNIWKDIPSGDKPPELLNMVVEVIMGSRDKYEYNLVDRVVEILEKSKAITKTESPISLTANRIDKS